jgi:hypothetical protein
MFLSALTSCKSPHKNIPPKESYVSFKFYPEQGKKYKKVYLSGDFNNWESSGENFIMKKLNGSFIIRIKKSLLKKGKNLYLFIADGEWIYDKKAKAFENRGIGGKVSVIHIN